MSRERVSGPVCQWQWFGETDGRSHYCDLPSRHRGPHAENGETFNEPVTS